VDNQKKEKFTNGVVETEGGISERHPTDKLLDIRKHLSAFLSIPKADRTKITHPIYIVGTQNVTWRRGECQEVSVLITIGLPKPPSAVLSFVAQTPW
jgi:hypothetical protein